MHPLLSKSHMLHQFNSVKDSLNSYLVRARTSQSFYLFLTLNRSRTRMISEAASARELHRVDRWMFRAWSSMFFKAYTKRDRRTGTFAATTVAEHDRLYIYIYTYIEFSETYLSFTPNIYCAILSMKDTSWSDTLVLILKYAGFLMNICFQFILFQMANTSITDPLGNTLHFTPTKNAIIHT